MSNVSLMFIEYSDSESGERWGETLDIIKTRYPHKKQPDGTRKPGGTYALHKRNVQTGEIKAVRLTDGEVRQVSRRAYLTMMCIVYECEVERYQGYIAEMQAEIQDSLKGMSNAE